jgi:Protein of unknown function (DUF2855)
LAEPQEFLIRRDDLRDTRVVETERPEIGEGQALLRVDRFGLTANNVTYAAFGEAMRYWEFFPAEDGWGHLPLWGFAEVEASSAEGVEAGARVYGYLPSSQWLVAEPAGAGERGFVDGVAHRATLPSAYQRYLVTEGDPFHTAETEELQMLLRPLYFTSWLLADDLRDGGMAGAATAVFSSASSKTALGTVFAMKQDAPEVEIVGLTSERSREMVEGLDVYDRVALYDDVASLGLDSATYVDFSGDGALRFAVHESLGDTLRASVAVGATSWDELGARGADSLPGPRPRFFFAPDRVTKRGADWGREGLEQRVADAWRPFVAWVDGWLEVEAAEGFDAAQKTYLELLDNKVGPAAAHVFSL